jgi:hypothetical protein
MFFSYYILACFFVGIASRAGSLEGDFEFGCFMWVTESVRFFVCGPLMACRQAGLHFTS